MRYFFTADTHFGHSRILQYCKRPFLTIAEHDAALIANWNACVRADDTVFHLGDFGWGKTEKLLDIRKQLRGRIHLIRGNHDTHMPRQVLDSFEATHYYSIIKIPDDKRHMTQRISLLHFPQLTWDGRKYGTWHLHAHTHGNLHEDIGLMRLDVGVDNFGFTPVPYETIRNIMESRAYESSRVQLEVEDRKEKS